MRPIRILWICAHRTHRYEEVSSLLRSGAEVVPIATLNSDFPNAIDYSEDKDPSYPPWRSSISIPESAISRVRQIDYFRDHSKLPGDIKTLINNWFDAVIIGSFTEIVVSFLGWFSGFVILRAFGGYPYSKILKPWTISGRCKLETIAHSPKYLWCPILPYLSSIEDSRITRNEIIIPPFVSKERLPYDWKGKESEPYVCDTISLIERYRFKEYDDYVDDFGCLPLRIFGNNDKIGMLAKDHRVVGTLSDEKYFSSLASCRVMLYKGLNTKFHLHYHVLEALMIKVPIIFFSNGSIAHISGFYGLEHKRLTEIGMCESPAEAISLAKYCLENVKFAVQLSEQQELLRNIFGTTEATYMINYLVRQMSLKMNYSVNWSNNNVHKKTSKISRIYSIIGNLLCRK